MIDMSSISPIETKNYAKKINAAGMRVSSMRRCPAAKSAPRRRRSPSWSAPTPATFDKVKPLFDLMGKNITLVGGNGDGQTCKVCNQIIVALNIEAVSEALVFAVQGRRRPGEGAPGADGRLCRLAHP